MVETVGGTLLILGPQLRRQQFEPGVADRGPGAVGHPSRDAALLGRSRRLSNQEKSDNEAAADHSIERGTNLSLHLEKGQWVVASQDPDEIARGRPVWPLSSAE